MFEKLSDALSILIAGPRITERLKDTRRAHEKANQSRKEVDQIIKDAELLEKAKQYKEDNKEK